VNQPSLFGLDGGDTATANIDGGSRGNPGPAAFGIRIERPDGTIVELKQALAPCTNHVAEYRGLLAALRWAAEHGISTSRTVGLGAAASSCVASASEPSAQHLYEEALRWRGGLKISSSTSAGSARRPIGWRSRAMDGPDFNNVLTIIQNANAEGRQCRCSRPQAISSGVLSEFCILKF
jgi:hypothetical protein